MVQFLFVEDNNYTKGRVEGDNYPKTEKKSSGEPEWKVSSQPFVDFGRTIRRRQLRFLLHDQVQLGPPPSRGRGSNFAVRES